MDISAEQTDEQFDPFTTVCDSDGNEVVTDDDSGPEALDSLIEDFEAEDGEDYLIAVTGFGGSTGEFELSVSRRRSAGHSRACR